MGKVVNLVIPEQFKELCFAAGGVTVGLAICEF